jgi:hypothetical protein
MITIDAKQLTTNSWLMSSSGNLLGYIYKNNDSYTILTQDTKQLTNSLDSAKLYFGDNVTEIPLSKTLSSLSERTMSEIDGYPVKHDDITIIRIDTPPLYSKVNSVYVAGYWAIKYSDIWVSVYCPLESTVHTYTAEGPFKTKLEMKSCISTNNKLKK